MHEQEQIKNTSNTLHIELNSKLTLLVLKVLLYCQNSKLCNKCILSILRLMRIHRVPTQWRRTSWTGGRAARGPRFKSRYDPLAPCARNLRESNGYLTTLQVAALLN